LGRSQRILFEHARKYKQYYDTVSAWYDRHDIICTGFYVILNSPLRSCHAVACIQEFIKGEKKDFFRDFSNDELFMLLEKDKRFKQQFFFARKTIDLYTKTGVCVDFAGECNLVIVDCHNSTRLSLIDYAYHKLDALKDCRGSLLKILDEQICRLGGLLRKIDQLIPL
jgi:hypothetical protein